MLCRALRHRLLVLCVVTLVTLGVPVAAHASWFNSAVSLTPKSYSHRNPRIQGTNVIYQSQRGGHWGIFRYNLLSSAETTIRSDSYDYDQHAIWGQWAVWTRDDSVYACNIGLPANPWKVASMPSSTWASFKAHQPDVYDDKIVYWRSHPSGTLGIYLGADKLPTQGDYQFAAAIYGNWVVYESGDGQVAPYSVVRAYNLQTHEDKRLKVSSAAQGDPDIYGTKVVYVDKRYGNADIFLYDLTTGVEKRLTTSTADQSNPSISGNWVVWTDKRHGASDIYVYGIAEGREQRVTQSEVSPGSRADVSGDRIVWQDTRDSYTRVYMRMIEHPQLSIAVSSTVEYGARATASGTLRTAGGAPIAGKTVALQSSRDGRLWSTAESTVTNGQGIYSLRSRPLTTARKLRVRFAGDSSYVSGTSPVKTVKPKAYLTTPSVSKRVYASKLFSTSTYLKPKHAAGTYPVRLLYYRRVIKDDGTSSWARKYTLRARAYDYLSYTQCKASRKLTVKGKWRVRALYEEDWTNAATVSEWRYFTVK